MVEFLAQSLETFACDYRSGCGGRRTPAAHGCGAGIGDDGIRDWEEQRAPDARVKARISDTLCCESVRSSAPFHLAATSDKSRILSSPIPAAHAHPAAAPPADPRHVPVCHSRADHAEHCSVRIVSEWRWCTSGGHAGVVRAFRAGGAGMAGISGASGNPGPDATAGTGAGTAGRRARRGTVHGAPDGRAVGCGAADFDSNRRTHLASTRADACRKQGCRCRAAFPPAGRIRPSHGADPDLAFPAAPLGAGSGAAAGTRLPARRRDAPAGQYVLPGGARPAGGRCAGTMAVCVAVSAGRGGCGAVFSGMELGDAGWRPRCLRRDRGLDGRVLRVVGHAPGAFFLVVLRAVRLRAQARDLAAAGLGRLGGAEHAVQPWRRGRVRCASGRLADRCTGRLGLGAQRAGAARFS